MYICVVISQHDRKETGGGLLQLHCENHESGLRRPRRLVVDRGRQYTHIFLRHHIALTIHRSLSSAQLVGRFCENVRIEKSEMEEGTATRS